MHRDQIGVHSVMEATIQHALDADRTIDITTTGRRTGEPRRIEIWFHNVDGDIYITGLPGTRDWYANLLDDPRFTFHLKESTTVDLPARAVPIRDDTERRRILAEITQRVNSTRPLESWVERSPLVRVEFD